MLSSTLIRHRRLLVFLTLGVVALAVLTEQVRSPDRRRIGWAGDAVEFVLAPAAMVLSRIGGAVSGAWSVLNEIGTLRTENAHLRAEVGRLREENARLRASEQENARLRTLLGFKEQEPYQTVAVRVVGRDPSDWFSTVLVDRGTLAGIRRNDSAVTSDGLVGHVIEAGLTWSRVLLLPDPRSAVGVLVVRSREAGVVEGQGQPLLRVKYLARDADVQPGDEVVTSGLGPIYPRSLVVGSVVEVSHPSGDMFEEAVVRPSADLSHLEELLIIVGDGAQGAR
ncbi:MAG TPA: rod shape-determining protein MreC [bacterium]|nr:rod shape-determining protein MreC [bacterium]